MIKGIFLAGVIRVRANDMGWYGCCPYSANNMLLFLIAEATINLITRVPMNAVAAYCIQPFDHPSLDGRRNWKRKKRKKQVGLTRDESFGKCPRNAASRAKQ